MKKLFISIFITSLIFLLFAPFASTQDITRITVFPTVQDINIRPGEKTHTQVQFQNASDYVITGDVKVTDFIIVDKEGTPVFINNPALKPKYSASSWINLGESFIAISPHNFATIDLYITPPSDLTSCGYYAALYFEPNPASAKKLGAKTESTSSVTVRLGALLNFIVAKDSPCRENINVSSFNVPKFIEFGPIKASFDLLNTGDIHLSPKGAVALTNILGAYVDSQPLKEQRIFPETVKTYEATVGHKWMIGRYKVQLLASYGQTGKKVAYEAYVFAFPWRVAIILILGIVIVYLFIRNFLKSLVKREEILEKEVEEEKEEIGKLREELKKEKN